MSHLSAWRLVIPAAVLVLLASLPGVVGAPRPPARWERLEIEIAQAPDTKQEKVKEKFRFGFRLSYTVTDDGPKIVNFEYTGASIPTTQDRVWAAEYVREARRKRTKADADKVYVHGVPLKSTAKQVLSLAPVKEYNPVTTGSGKRGFDVSIRWSLHDVENGTIRFKPQSPTEETQKRVRDGKVDPLELMAEFDGFQATSGACSSAYLAITVVEGEYRLLACIDCKLASIDWTPVRTERTNPFPDANSGDEPALENTSITVQWKPKGKD